MKKFIFTAVLTLAFVAQSYAQSAYFLFDEGAKLTIANTDAKGKHTGYSTLEVKEVVGSRSNCTVKYESMVYDKKMNPLLTAPVVQKFTVRNGVVTYDPQSMAGQVMQGMQVTVEGTPFALPAGAKVGDTFPDYNIVMNIAGLKTTSNVTGQKVVAEEHLYTLLTGVCHCILQITAVSHLIPLPVNQSIVPAHIVRQVNILLYLLEIL